MEQAQVSASNVPAGWHPDPHTPGHLRWRDGIGWTPHTRPAVQQQVPFPTTAQAVATPQQSAYDPATAAMMQRAERHESLVHDNPKSVFAMAVSVIYLLVALYAGIYLLGIVPGLAAFRAFESKERLAPVAAIGAAVVIVIGIMHFGSR
jgi:hypothetical protein